LKKCCRLLSGAGDCPTKVKAGGSCFSADGWWQTFQGFDHPPDAAPGQLMAELNEEERGGQDRQADTRIDRETWREVQLVMHDPEKGPVRIRRLYPVEWLLSQKADVGTKVFLDLGHVGVCGWATVRAVEPCPELERGPGRRVLATFAYEQGEVWNLRVEGEEKPIGVTAMHPFWSADRQAWVSAGELRIGERLQAEDGSTPRVVSLTLRAAAEPVYNIEVDGDHCYRVGRQGLLVHNASNPCTDGGLAPGEELVVNHQDVWLPDPRSDIAGAEILIKYIKVEEKIANLKRGRGTGSNDASYRLISGDDYPKRVGIFVRNTQQGRDTVGHIVPNAFGGLGHYRGPMDNGFGNIFPQEYTQNNTTDSALVQEFIRLVDATPPHCVCARWIFKDWQTPRHPYRPRRYVVEYYVDGSTMPTTVRINNPDPS
jgi:hypothetical protein